jgi:5,10-methylenetetrahydromethanopterin reductase
MRIGIMIGHEHLLLSQPGESMRRRPDLDALVRETQLLEARGFASTWLVHVFALDAIGAITIIGRETQRMELGTAVVPTFPRHPYTMAQQALTAQVAARGRFTLGIGLSHAFIIENMFGLSYDRPARHMREYLSVLTPLLEGQPVAFHGQLYHVNAELRFPDVARVPLLVAALGPVMLELAGRFADGTVTWMTGPRTLETYIGPRIRKAAQEAGRPAPRVVAGLPIAITNAPGRAREVAGEVLAIYGVQPSYRAMLDREGVSNPADIALVGDAAAVEEELRRLSEIGVTDLLAAPFEADTGAMERTIDFLAGHL